MNMYIYYSININTNRFSKWELGEMGQQQNEVTYIYYILYTIYIYIYIGVTQAARGPPAEIMRRSWRERALRLHRRRPATPAPVWCSRAACS